MINSPQITAPMFLLAPDRARLEMIVSSILQRVSQKKFASRGDVLEFIETLENFAQSIHLTYDEKKQVFSDIIAQSPEELNLDDPHFDGAAYDKEHDQKRLTKGLYRVFHFMMDGQWHTIAEIAQGSNVPENSASAHYRALRKPRWGAHIILRRCPMDRSHGLFQYKLVPNEDAETYRLYCEDTPSHPNQ